MNIDFNQILFYITVLSFLGGAFYFIHQTGIYKANVQDDIEDLQSDFKEYKQNFKELQNEVSEIKTNNAQVISRMETLLIEVKTKIELIMQFSGFFNNENNQK